MSDQLVSGDSVNDDLVNGDQHACAFDDVALTVDMELTDMNDERSSLIDISNISQSTIQFSHFSTQVNDATEECLEPSVPLPSFSITTFIQLIMILLCSILLSSVSLLIRSSYSMTTQSYPYNLSFVVLMAACLKFSLSILGLMFLTISPRQQLSTLSGNGVIKFSVPALCYAIENVISFPIISRLGPALFLVINNIKIIITVLISRLYLCHHQSMGQWMAIGILTIGIIIVQLPSISLPNNKSSSDFVIGVVLVVVNATLSSVANVWSQQLLQYRQSTSISLHLQNLQLYCFEILISFLILIIVEGSTSKFQCNRDGTVSTFHCMEAWVSGWSLVVVFIILCSSFTGLSVSWILKYQGAIVYVFCGPLSIVIVSLASLVLFDDTLSILFVIGATMVVVSTVMFNLLKLGDSEKRRLEEAVNKEEAGRLMDDISSTQ